MSGTFIRVVRFRDGASLPEKKTDMSSGWDLRACLDHPFVWPVIIDPGATAVINTGLNVAIPKGWELQIRSRSGLAAKSGVFVLNSPGTIDADYCGEGPDFEIKVILHNTSGAIFAVNHGDRIAQAVLSPVYDITWVEDSELVAHDSNRVGGLGSTGVK